jgi:hypothetical protein
VRLGGAHVLLYGSCERLTLRDVLGLASWRSLARAAALVVAEVDAGLAAVDPVPREAAAARRRAAVISEGDRAPRGEAELEAARTADTFGGLLVAADVGDAADGLRLA